MRFELTDVQRDIQRAVTEFAEKEFDSEVARELERERRFPRSIFEKACKLGFIGIDYPEPFGGQSFSLIENVLVTEAFCRKDSGIGIAISSGDRASGVISRHGDENQKREFLTPVTQGRAVNTVALVDSVHGEKGIPVLTTAQEEESEYVVSGKKSYVINGQIADVILTFCETSSATSSHSIDTIGLVIDRNQKGVNIIGGKKFMGMRMSSIDEVSFDRVKVSKNHRVLGGQEPLKDYLIEQRVKTSAQALGIAQGAFERAVNHAKEREQFGKKIGQFQGIQFLLAELLVSIEAARSLVYRAAYDCAAKAADAERISSIARLFATDVAVRTAIESIQIHGGVGLMKEYPVERMLRDAKTIQNLEETNLVQKAIIAGKIISQK